MIRRWWRRSVQFRLVSFFLLLSWSSVVTVGTLAFVRARQELSAAALTRLEARRRSRATSCAAGSSDNGGICSCSRPGRT